MLQATDRLMARTLEVPPDVAAQVAAALREDVGGGDVTASLVPATQLVRGEVVSREDAVICGAPWVVETFRQLAPEISLEWAVRDGESVSAGATVFRLQGLARPVLTGERTALNFLQLLSGTATTTRQFVDAIAGTHSQILDTRKSLPGLRTAQKYAVRCGGARNHRMGLYDMVLIKENHIAAAGSLTAAISAARRLAPQVQLEAEVENLAELEQALAAGPDIILLDDFTLEDLRSAVQRVRATGSPVKLEASGSVNLQTVRSIAETGVDYISVGSLTKHVRAIDLSMRLEFSTQPPT
jgi:nicotinate-nucleotide pyrophosphorylase (carboxylating)